MKKLILSIAALASIGIITGQTYDTSGTYFINEIIASPPNSSSILINNTDNTTDNITPYLHDTDLTFEYFELRGPAGTALPANTYFITVDGDGDDSDVGNNIGRVADVIDVSGIQFGSNGIIAIVANAVIAAETVDGDGITTPSLDSDNNPITVDSRITNVFADALSSSDATVITVEVSGNPIWEDRRTLDAGEPSTGTESFRGLTNVTITDPNNTGYDGTFNDQSNNFFLITAPTAPSTSHRIDVNEDGVIDAVGDGSGIDTSAEHLSWIIYDSISILDNDDLSAGDNEVGEFGYGQIIFAEDLTATDPLLNFDSTLSTVVTIGNDPQYVARGSDSDGGYAATDFLAGRINSSSFLDQPFENLVIGSSDGEFIPATFGGSDLPNDTFGGANPISGAVLSVADNEILNQSVVLSRIDNTLNIRTIQGTTINEAAIYSMDGRQMFYSKNNISTIDLSTFSTGAYIMRIDTNIGSDALLFAK